MIEIVEAALNVCIQYPFDPSVHTTTAQLFQRLMGGSSLAKTIREVVKILLIDVVQDVRYCSLHYLIFYRTYAQRSFLACTFIYPRPANIGSLILP